MRVVIVDDEKSARGILRLFLKDHSDVEIVGEASDGQQAHDLCEELKPDVIFLDIQMPVLTGLEMLDVLEDPPWVIFTTAYDEFAVQAFEKNAVDYLLKPFNKDRLAQSLVRVRERIETSRAENAAQTQKVAKELEQRKVLERIPVKIRGKIHVVQVCNLVLAEAEGDYVMLNTFDGRYLKEITMKYLEKHLPADEFCRIHRSSIVRIGEVQSIEPIPGSSSGQMVVLKSGIKVRASADGLRRLKKALGN